MSLCVLCLCGFSLFCVGGCDSFVVFGVGCVVVLCCVVFVLVLVCGWCVVL